MAELKQKIKLKTKGDSTGLLSNSLISTLTWKKAIDLDLHAFYLRKNGKKGHCYFGNKSDFCMMLSGDKGIGDVAGNNIETIKIIDLSQFEKILIATNIYNKPNANFSKYDGIVTVKCGSKEIEVPLTSTSIGSWCTIAMLDNSSITSEVPKLININSTTKTKPTITSGSGGLRKLLNTLFRW